MNYRCPILITSPTVFNQYFSRVTLAQFACEQKHVAVQIAATLTERNRRITLYRRQRGRGRTRTHGGCPRAGNLNIVIKRKLSTLVIETARKPKLTSDYRFGGRVSSIWLDNYHANSKNMPGHAIPVLSLSSIPTIFGPVPSPRPLKFSFQDTTRSS